jgi:UDP-2,3-diacylglucosamine hydrolase
VSNTPNAPNAPKWPADAGHLHAQAHWRCIDFISDLHLHDGLPLTLAALAQHLATTNADAVLLLGDIFEAWVGDDMRSQPFEAQCTQMLAQAGRRLHLGLMVGNRDFLVGHDMITACHAHALPDPTVLHAFGQQALLIHGDELCLADAPYLKFRTQVRSAAWQQVFTAQPLPQRLAQARQMRQASMAKQQGQQPETWADVDEGAARSWLQAAQSSTLVHGHTHRPADEAFAGGTRHVLSDWDLDGGHGHARAEVLRWTADGWHRLSLTPVQT